MISRGLLPMKEFRFIKKFTFFFDIRPKYEF